MSTFRKLCVHAVLAQAMFWLSIMNLLQISTITMHDLQPVRNFMHEKVFPLTMNDATFCVYEKLKFGSGKSSIFTARCTLMQSAILRSHVVCLSVRLSDRL